LKAEHDTNKRPIHDVVERNVIPCGDVNADIG
jgi:hypothetical protein